MKINVSEIESITIRLLDMLKQSKGELLEFSNDYYWDILDNELFNPYKDPTNITLGQLSDELTELDKVKNLNNATIYDLKRLGIIFRALSYENPTAF